VSGDIEFERETWDTFAIGFHLAPDVGGYGITVAFYCWFLPITFRRGSGE